MIISKNHKIKAKNLLPPKSKRLQNENIEENKENINNRNIKISVQERQFGKDLTNHISNMTGKSHDNSLSKRNSIIKKENNSKIQIVIKKTSSLSQIGNKESNKKSVSVKTIGNKKENYSQEKKIPATNSFNNSNKNKTRTSSSNGAGRLRNSVTGNIHFQSGLSNNTRKTIQINALSVSTTKEISHFKNTGNKVSETKIENVNTQHNNAHMREIKKKINNIHINSNSHNNTLHLSNNINLKESVTLGHINKNSSFRENSHCSHNSNNLANHNPHRSNTHNEASSGNHSQPKQFSSTIKNDNKKLRNNNTGKELVNKNISNVKKEKTKEVNNKININKSNIIEEQSQENSIFIQDYNNEKLNKKNNNQDKSIHNLHKERVIDKNQKDKEIINPKSKEFEKEKKEPSSKLEIEINKLSNTSLSHPTYTIQCPPQMETPKSTTNKIYKTYSSKIDNKYFNIPKIDKHNVQIPAEYLNEIYNNLLLEERQGLDPKPIYNYMTKQKEVNEQMRSILVDWLIDVHLKFGFMDETIYMTVLIIDRYLSLEEITRSKLQLLGIVALMIACKHEEIDLPKVDDFIYITDNAYTRDEVFDMENKVLNKLKFNLLYPSPIKFFELLANGFEFNNKQLMMGKYLMESFLIDIKNIKYRPSVIACACAYIVMKFFKMSNYQCSYDEKYTLIDDDPYYSENSPEAFIKECAKDICVFVDNVHKTNFLSTQKKFSKEKYEKVALLILGQ